MNRRELLKSLGGVLVCSAIPPFAMAELSSNEQKPLYRFISPDYPNDGFYPSVKTGYYITSFKIIDRDAWFSVIGSDNYLDISSTEETIYGNGYDWTYAAVKVSPFDTLKEARKCLHFLKSSEYNYYSMMIDHIPEVGFWTSSDYVCREEY